MSQEPGCHSPQGDPHVSGLWGPRRQNELESVRGWIGSPVIICDDL